MNASRKSGVPAPYPLTTPPSARCAAWPWAGSRGCLLVQSAGRNGRPRCTRSSKPQSSITSIRKLGSPTFSPGSPTRRRLRSPSCYHGIGGPIPCTERPRSRGLRRRVTLIPAPSLRTKRARSVSMPVFCFVSPKRWTYDQITSFEDKRKIGRWHNGWAQAHDFVERLHYPLVHDPSLDLYPSRRGSPTALGSPGVLLQTLLLADFPYD